MSDHGKSTVMVYTYLGWKGFAIPMGRWAGEWAWVGRCDALPVFRPRMQADAEPGRA